MMLPAVPTSKLAEDAEPLMNCPACGLAMINLPVSDREIVMCPKCGHIFRSINGVARNMTPAEKLVLRDCQQAAVIRAVQVEVVKGMWG